MVIMRNSSTGSPHFAQSNFVRQKSLGVRFFKTDQHNQVLLRKRHAGQPAAPHRSGAIHHDRISNVSFTAWGKNYICPWMLW